MWAQRVMGNVFVGARNDWIICGLLLLACKQSVTEATLGPLQVANDRGRLRWLMTMDAWMVTMAAGADQPDVPG